MIQDPYRVLGVSPGATQDEIKRAYRRKAKENHPDLHPNDPEASKRMNEINEAYDMLMNPEKYAQRRAQEQQAEQARQARQTYQQQGYGGYGGYGSYGGGGQDGGYQQQGGWGYGPFGFGFDDMFGFGAQQTAARPQHQSGDSETVRRAVDLINARQYQQAVSVLNGVTSAGRNARWNYLAALAYEGLGNTVQALDFIRRAVQLDPNTPEYRRVMQQLQQSGQTYEQSGRGYGMDMSGVGRMCTTFCVANMLCNCLCGGRGMYLCC